MISASDFYKSTFNSKVYRLSLDAGCTCPTRDGTLGTRGCIFCSAMGSGEFSGAAKAKDCSAVCPPEGLRAVPSVKDQIRAAKALVASKARGRSGKRECRYIAYFQNFTSTYGNTAALVAKYSEALAEQDVVGLAVATRPDCLKDDMLAELALIAADVPFVSIELGLQTSKPESAQYIRRGYSNSVYEDAVYRIRNASPRIHIVTHVIFGLPGETEGDMLETVRYVARSPFAADGIKFTVLHVLEGTDLAEEWRAEHITCMSQEEYFAVLGKALTLLPENMVVHRLTGDGPKKLLLAPLWTADKKRVLNEITKSINPTLQ